MIKCCFPEVSESIAITFNEVKFSSCFLTPVHTLPTLLDYSTLFYIISLILILTWENSSHNEEQL